MSTESVETRWGHFFKPEVRKQGQDIYDEGAVSLSIAGDDQIQAFVRVSSGARVSFRATSISSSTFDASCNCPSATKGQLCKHIWATLLKVEESSPDFLSSKTNLEAVAGPLNAKSESKLEKRVDPRREELLEKQALHRKAQYQRAKEFAKVRSDQAKEQRAAQKSSRKLSKNADPVFPEEVEVALRYFSQNGFDLAPEIEIENLRNAKRVLSRVFHPDKGGSHDEILTLNENFDVLFEFKRES